MLLSTEQSLLLLRVIFNSLEQLIPEFCKISIQLCKIVLINPLELSPCILAQTQLYKSLGGREYPMNIWWESITCFLFQWLPSFSHTKFISVLLLSRTHRPEDGHFLVEVVGISKKPNIFALFNNAFRFVPDIPDLGNTWGGSPFWKKKRKKNLCQVQMLWHSDWRIQSSSLINSWFAIEIRHYLYSDEYKGYSMYCVKIFVLVCGVCVSFPSLVHSRGWTEDIRFSQHSDFTHWLLGHFGPINSCHFASLPVLIKTLRHKAFIMCYL